MLGMKQLSLESHSKLLQLVAHYESVHDGDLSQIGLQPKMCPAGYWTEGFGRLVRDSKGFPIKGINNKKLAYDCVTIKTIEQAKTALGEDLEDVYLQVQKLPLVLNENETVAIVSFCYNLGVGKFTKSNFFKYVQRKFKASLITVGFLSFNKANGVELKGLTYRRKTEALMFNTGELKFFN